MNVSEITKLFLFTCNVYDQTAKEEKLVAWRKSLGNFEEAELRAALDAWMIDMTEVEYFGDLRPRGALMPSHTDLLRLVMKARNRRAPGDRFVACGIDGCSEGYRLEYRETKIYGKPQKERFAAECECRKDWNSGRRPAAAPKTLDSDLILLKSLRRVQ